MTVVPTGIGLYTRRLGHDRHGTPKALAKRFADHGLAWVAIAGPWHDAKRQGLANSPETVERYADAFAALGVQPWIWGYPWHDRIDLFVRDMLAVSVASVGGRWLIDPEVGFKRRPEAAAILCDQCSEHCTSLGWTSYGLLSAHKTFPAAVFARGCDWGSPQLYTRDDLIPSGLSTWDGICGEGAVVPSFGLYRRGGLMVGGKRVARPKTGEELAAHLACFARNGPIRALLGWELAFVTPELWRVLAACPPLG